MKTRAQEKSDAAQALVQARARSAVTAGEGVYNVSPWGLLLGILGAACACVFALYALTRPPKHPQTKGPAKPVTAATPSAAVSAAHDSPGELIWLE